MTKRDTGTTTPTMTSAVAPGPRPPLFALLVDELEPTGRLADTVEADPESEVGLSPLTGVKERVAVVVEGPDAGCRFVVATAACAHVSIC